MIWGPRDRHLFPQLLSRVRNGRLWRVGDGKNLVDNVYVENAARAHLLAADALKPGSPAAGRAYFISQGEPVNCWDWLNELVALAGLPPVRKSISFRTAWAIGLACEMAYGLLRLRRAAHDAISGRAIVAVALLQHPPCTGGSRLHTHDFHRGRHAATGRGRVLES